MVTPNPLSSFFLTPTGNYGTLSVNAQGIVLGNSTSVVQVPGSLVIVYVDVAGVSHNVTLGKFLSQTTRTRL